MPAMRTESVAGAFPARSSDCELSTCREFSPEPNSTSPESDTSSSHKPSLADDGELDRSTEPEPKRQKRRRAGRIVNVLRQRYDLNNFHSHELNIGPSSSSASLSSYALQASLNFHLVHTALETLEFVSSMGWHDLATSLADLRLVGSKRADAYLETLVACACALGARTATHSMITGVTTADSEICNAEQMAELGLGKRREAACLALANRAMAMAEDEGLLTETSERAKSLATFMRAIFSCLMPVHPQARAVTVSLQGQLDLAKPMADKDTKMFLFYDASTSYQLGQAPVFSDAEFARLSGVPTMAELLEFTADENGPRSFDETWTDIAVVAFRKLCALQLSKLIPTAELESTFSDLSRLADLCRAMLPTIVRRCKSYFEKPVNRELAVMKLMTQFELAMFCQAKRHVKGRNLSLWHAAQARLVEYIALLTRTIQRHKLSTTTIYLAANQFMAFHAVPEWTQLVVDAVAQQNARDGPLAPAKFTRVDLDSLQRTLKVGSTVFAALADRERDLMHFMVEADLAPRPRRGRALARTGSGEARFMIERAMSDILAN